MIPAAAMKLGRPVKWQEDRREHFLAVDAGARSVLEGRHRGRQRRQDSRRSRQHAARHRRLSAVGHHRAVHRLDHAAGALCHPGLQDRKHRRADQPGADHRRARRRAAAGGVRDGAAHGPRRPRIEDRPRRIARPQHHPARPDALFAGPDLSRRQADGLCQRRFSEEPAPRHRAFEIRKLPRPAEQGPRRGPLSRHRHRQLCRGHRLRTVRGRHHPHHAERQGRGRDWSDDARPGHPHHAVADRRRSSGLPHRRHRDERGRHRHDLAGHRRLRQPAGDQRRLVGDDRRRQCEEAGDRGGVPRARHSGKRHRRRGRQRPSRAPATSRA